MNYPTQIIKLLGILLFLLLFFLSSSLTVHAASQVTLTGMKKLEQIDHTQIPFLFTELPSFTVEHSGQRVDLLLKEVVVSATLRSLPEDEAVVKIMLAQKYRDLLMSLLLRRAPSEVITESSTWMVMLSAWLRHFPFMALWNRIRVPLTASSRPRQSGMKPWHNQSIIIL